MSGHKCCRLKSVMLLHAITALPIQCCLGVVQMVMEVASATNELSWPWHLEQSGLHLPAKDAVAALIAATLKFHRVGKPDMYTCSATFYV